MNEIMNANTDLLPDGYAEWRKDIEHLIEVAKLRTAINVNADTLALYWTLGKRILAQQRQLGAGEQISYQNYLLIYPKSSLMIEDTL